MEEKSYNWNISVSLFDIPHSEAVKLLDQIIDISDSYLGTFITMDKVKPKGNFITRLKQAILEFVLTLKYGK